MTFVLGVLAVGAVALVAARWYSKRMDPDNPHAKRIASAGTKYWLCTVPMMVGLAVLEESSDGMHPLAIVFVVLVAAWLLLGERLLASYGIRLYESADEAKTAAPGRRGRRRAAR